MIPSDTNPEPFNGSHDMVSISASVNERTAARLFEVIVTARASGGSVWTTTILIPPLSEHTPARDIAFGEN